MIEGRRVRVPGVGERASGLTFRFEGRPVAAAAGESIAAALTAAGEPAFRQTRGGTDRGVFCGMGVCHECLVSADGDTVRACMTPAAAGMTVERHRPRTAQAPAPGAGAQAPCAVDVAVVGAGPAGLSAALAAARAGLSVALVDERKQAGGQYFKQPADAFPLTPRDLDEQFRRGRALVGDAMAAGVLHLSGAAVWSTTGGDDLLLDGPGGARQLRYRRLVLATGAAERAAPFPGWTMPGVMTTGAAQTLLRAYGVVPGGRIVIAGSGPLNLQLAAALVDAGARSVVLAEASRGLRPAVAGVLADMAVASPALVAEGLRYRWTLARARVPVLHGTVVCEAVGDGTLKQVLLAPLSPDGRPDRLRSSLVEADVLCVGYGFLPAVELAAAIGCELRYDARWKHLAVVRDADGRTSLPQVFAAGDGAGFGGARAAEAEGTLAGIAAALDCGAAETPALVRARDGARSALERARRFQAALWQLYDAPVPTHHLADPGTLVCRCEEVSLTDVEAACDAGARSLGAVKRATRLGMGRCQGRYCAPVAADLLAGRGGRPPQPDDFFAPRTPLRPVPIGAIAALDLGTGSTDT